MKQISTKTLETQFYQHNGSVLRQVEFQLTIRMGKAPKISNTIALDASTLVPSKKSIAQSRRQRRCCAAKQKEQSIVPMQYFESLFPSGSQPENQNENHGRENASAA